MSIRGKKEAVNGPDHSLVTYTALTSSPALQVSDKGCSMLQEHTKNDIEDEKQKAESEFFEYVSKSYRCFLAGDDEQCEQVDGAKAAEFEERASEIRNHNKLLQDVSEIALS